MAHAALQAVFGRPFEMRDADQVACGHSRRVRQSTWTAARTIERGRRTGTGAEISASECAASWQAKGSSPPQQVQGRRLHRMVRHGELFFLLWSARCVWPAKCVWPPRRASVRVARRAARRTSRLEGAARFRCRGAGTRNPDVQRSRISWAALESSPASWVGWYSVVGAAKGRGNLALPCGRAAPALCFRPDGRIGTV